VPRRRVWVRKPTGAAGGRDGSTGRVGRGEGSHTAPEATMCMSMKRTTVLLDETTAPRLEQQARQRRQPKTVLIREALDQYLDRGPQDRLPRLAFVAAGRSGRSDVAERHDELLWREPDAEPGA
jgi:predicted transcriptional regulator